MTEQIKAEERLARACAGLSTTVLQEIGNALQAYHEQYYGELIGAGPNDVMRAQGKVLAVTQIIKTIVSSREIVVKIDARRAGNKVPEIK